MADKAEGQGDEKKPPETTKKDDDKGGQGDGGPSLAQQIKEAAAEAVRELVGKGGAKPDPAADVAAQVQEAVRIVREGDEAARRRAEAEAAQAAKEKKNEKPEPEKAPRLYRRITTLVWGQDDDDE